MKRKISDLLFIYIYTVASVALAQTDDPIDKAEKQAQEVQEYLKLKDEQKRDLNALREAGADTTEYTVSPNSVQLLVEMDPFNYGFSGRNHRMSITTEFDLILRGRAFFHYDYRFFEYLSFGFKAGVDWTRMSLLSNFNQKINQVSLEEFTLLFGGSAKWRLTEWYLRSAFFLEPSLLFGPMWQNLNQEKNRYFRIRPGLSINMESVFDSGFVFNIALGGEIPFDLGNENPVSKYIEPVFMVGFGLAL